MRGETIYRHFLALTPKPELLNVYICVVSNSQGLYILRQYRLGGLRSKECFFFSQLVCLALVCQFPPPPKKKMLGKKLLQGIWLSFDFEGRYMYFVSKL